MDLISHAAAGAATGQIFGKPLTGAMIAVIPDLCLVGPRVKLPPPIYDFCHSFLYLAIMTWAGYIIGHWELLFLCTMSHLALDMPAHGKEWGPTLFYPSKYRYVGLGEWEFFNRPWFFGLAITIGWISLCQLHQHGQMNQLLQSLDIGSLF